MKTNKEIIDFLNTPNRQSPVAIFIILFRFIWLFIRQAFPLVIVFFINPARLQDSFWSIVGVGVAIIPMTLSIISYFKYYYYIQGNELIIEKGIFQKRKLNIPFDRIQTINFKQNIIHQIFNVVALELDTAGSGKNEVSIDALRKEEAEAIRTFLIAKKKEHIDSTGEGETSVNAIEEKETLLLRLSFSDLLKIGIGQNHLRTAGLILFTIYGIFEFAESVFGEKGLKKELTELGFIRENVFIIGISFLIFMVITSFLFTLISTALKYYDLRFLRQEKGFKIIAGLFNRKERSAKMQKIQLVDWSTNPIKQIFSLWGLRLRQAGSSAIQRRQALYVPGCYNSQIDAVRNAYFPEENLLEFEEHSISKKIIFRRMLYFGIVPLLPILLFQYFNTSWINLWLLLWLPFIYWTSLIYYKKWKLYISEKGLRVRNGLVGTKYILLKWYKIQSIKIRQSIYQRRHQLADITFYTAAGSVTIPFLTIEKAQFLQDFVLYKVETSQKAWM